MAEVKFALRESGTRGTRECGMKGEERRRAVVFGQLVRSQETKEASQI